MNEQQIKIPQQISKDINFALRISQKNDIIYHHIQYLKHLVENIYEVYEKMNKQVLTLSSDYQNKISKFNDATAVSITNFVKGIQKIYMNMQTQMSNNQMNMNKKNQKVSKTRKDIIHQKLVKINNLFKLFMQKVNQYNIIIKQYQQECLYFEKIETQSQVIRFYSIKQNKTLFQILTRKQILIQELLQETYSIKIQLKSGICQLRLSLKEFFQMLNNNSQEDRKLLLSVRKKLKDTKIFNETIIQQVNSQAQQSFQQHMLKQKSYNLSQKLSKVQLSSQFKAQLSGQLKVQLSDRFKVQEFDQLKVQEFDQFKGQVLDQFKSTFSNFNVNITIEKDREQIINNVQMEAKAIQIFCDFNKQFFKIIVEAGTMIDTMRSTKQFQQFIDKKFQINQILTSDMITNSESIKNQIADVRQIILTIKSLLDKRKVINQLMKYRQIKYTRFLTDTQGMIQIQKSQKHKNKNKSIENLRLTYYEHKQKLIKAHVQLMRRFRQMIQQIFKQLNQKFKIQRSTQETLKKQRTESVQKKYFQILMLSFFMKKEQPPKFKPNSFLKHYEKYITDEKLKKVGLTEFITKSNDFNQQGKKKNSLFIGCCGLLNKAKASVPMINKKYIDQYNCALKKGIVLVQGKMKLHANYLKFLSSFNTNTFFGSSNVRIPTTDILNIQKGQYLLSIKITIITVQGPMQFTSFLTDPYEKLLQIYQNKQIKLTNNINGKKQLTQNSFNDSVDEKSILKASHLLIKTHDYTKQYILQLQEKFQCDIPQLIDKHIFNIESLSTYLSQSKKQLSVSLQYHLVTNLNTKYFFQIKIVQRNLNLDFKFIHQKSMEDQKIKKKLQKLAVYIINTNRNTTNTSTIANAYGFRSTMDQDFHKYRQKDQITGRHQSNQQKISLGSCSFIQRRENYQFQLDKDPSFVYMKQPFHNINEGDPSFNYIPDLQIFKNLKNDNKDCNRSRNSSKNKSKNSLSAKQIQEYMNSVEGLDISRKVKKESIQDNKVKVNENTTLDKQNNKSSSLTLIFASLFFLVLINSIFSMFKRV